MQQRYGQLITGLLIGLVLGLFIGKQLPAKTAVPPVPVQVPTVQDNKPADKPVVTHHSSGTDAIPQKVYDVLNYIRAHNQPMPGYVGGRVFSNREEILPREDNNGKPILYHEWDVNPKVAGQNRGTERIITGSDGRAWYTNDHYQSFKEIVSS